MSARKRTNEQILSSLLCNFTEAAQVLNMGWKAVDDLVTAKKLRSMASGRRTKIVVKSLSEFIEREAEGTT